MEGMVMTGNSTYVFKEGQVIRINDQKNNPMRRDNEFVPVHQVLECEVGKPLKMVIQLKDQEDENFLTLRVTGPVQFLVTDSDGVNVDLL